MENFITFDNLEDLDAESKYLVHKAKEACNHAYAPYSKFMVGAAVLLADGKVVIGCNQENAAYPSGMCAERVALFAVASQHPDQKIVKIAVTAKRKNAKELLPATCCGSCRQVMLEFETRQQEPIKIVMSNREHHWVITPSVESLLPFSFSKADLERDNDQQHA